MRIDRRGPRLRGRPHQHGHAGQYRRHRRRDCRRWPAVVLGHRRLHGEAARPLRQRTGRRRGRCASSWAGSCPAAGLPRHENPCLWPVLSSSRRPTSASCNWPRPPCVPAWKCSCKGQTLTPDSIILAGAFGTYVKAASARRIGLLPEWALDPRAGGNSALRGARLLLLCPSKRDAIIEAVLNRCQHVELATDPAFQDAYVDEMPFPGS